MALLSLSAEGVWALLLVSFLHAAALAPLAPLSDTLALGAAAPARRNDASEPGFDYGWIRGAGSAAFIVGTVLSGQLVGAYGIATVIWLQALLLVTAAGCAPWLRQIPQPAALRSTMASAPRGGVV